MIAKRRPSSPALETRNGRSYPPTACYSEHRYEQQSMGGRRPAKRTLDGCVRGGPIVDNGRGRAPRRPAYMPKIGSILRVRSL
jgi:hypothetical protein